MFNADIFSEKVPCKKKSEGHAENCNVKACTIAYSQLLLD